MFLRKFNLIFSVITLLSILVNGGCTKINEVVVPPPDFAKLIVSTKTFVGSKLHDTDPFRSITDGYVIEVIGEGEKIFFQEKKKEYDRQGKLVTNIYKYEVQLDNPKYRNGVGFTIPEQIVNGVKYKGLPYKGETEHGYYELETVSKEPSNTIFFKLATSKSTWSYFLRAKK